MPVLRSRTCTKKIYPKIAIRKPSKRTNKISKKALAKSNKTMQRIFTKTKSNKMTFTQTNTKMITRKIAVTGCNEYITLAHPKTLDLQNLIRILNERRTQKFKMELNQNGACTYDIQGTFTATELEGETNSYKIMNHIRGNAYHIKNQNNEMKTVLFFPFKTTEDDDFCALYTEQSWDRILNARLGYNLEKLLDRKLLAKQYGMNILEFNATKNNETKKVQILALVFENFIDVLKRSEIQNKNIQEKLQFVLTNNGYRLTNPNVWIGIDLNNNPKVLFSAQLGKGLRIIDKFVLEKNFIHTFGHGDFVIQSYDINQNTILTNDGQFELVGQSDLQMMIDLRESPSKANTIFYKDLKTMKNG